MSGWAIGKLQVLGFLTDLTDGIASAFSELQFFPSLPLCQDRKETSVTQWLVILINVNLAYQMIIKLNLKV